MIGLPQFNVKPIDENGHWTRSWWLFFNNWVTGSNATGTEQPPDPVTVGTSPYIYIAEVAGSLIVQGGGISAMAFSRDGLNWYPVGYFYSMFPLSAGDMLRFTFPGAAPVLTFVRR